MTRHSGFRFRGSASQHLKMRAPPVCTLSPKPLNPKPLNPKPLKSKNESMHQKNYPSTSERKALGRSMGGRGGKGSCLGFWFRGLGFKGLEVQGLRAPLSSKTINSEPDFLYPALGFTQLFRLSLCPTWRGREDLVRVLCRLEASSTYLLSPPVPKP